MCNKVILCAKFESLKSVLNDRVSNDVIDCILKILQQLQQNHCYIRNIAIETLWSNAYCNRNILVDRELQQNHCYSQYITIETLWSTAYCNRNIVEDSELQQNRCYRRHIAKKKKTRCGRMHISIETYLQTASYTRITIIACILQ